MLQCFALDLVDDEKSIECYEAYHRAVWPEVIEHLRLHGVTQMRIWRLGTRLVMVMETDDSIHDPKAMAVATRDDPQIAKWEELMWRFQQPTPWTSTGEKWIPMKEVFCLPIPLV